jgi:glyoxylase I family protein
MIQRLHHTGFVVRDLDNAVEFYRDVVGLEVMSEYERRGEGIDQVIGYPNAHLKAATLGIGEDHVLELIQYVHPRSEERLSGDRSMLGAAHLALQVDNIAAMFERMCASGAKMMNSPAELAPGRWACYFQDPDDNWLELLELSG